jgi:hypothetical protein
MTYFSKCVASGDVYKIFHHTFTCFKTPSIVQTHNVQSELYYRLALQGDYTIIMDWKGYERNRLNVLSWHLLGET